MDVKPRGGRGRGRGKEAFPAPSPEQLKEKVHDETSKLVDVSVDSVHAVEVKTGSPRGRGIGRGRGKPRTPPLDLPVQEKETRTPPVLNDKFQDKEQIPEKSNKTDRKSHQSFSVSGVQDTVAGGSYQKGGHVPSISELKDVVSGEIHQIVGQVPPVSEVKDVVSMKIHQNDGQAVPVSGAREAVTGKSHQKVPPVSEAQHAVAGESHKEEVQREKHCSTSSDDSDKTMIAVTVIGERAAGISGEPLEMKNNYFIVNLRPGHTGAAEYHVSTEPVVEHLDTIRNLLKTEQADDFIGKVQVLDGKVLYLFTILPGSDIVSFKTNLEENDYTVNLELMTIKAMDEAMAIINGLLGKLMYHLGYKKTGGHFYDPRMEKIMSHHRVRIWPGIDLTAEYQNESFKVSVDCTRLILQQDSVFDHLVKLGGDPQKRSKFEKLIVGKTVLAKYNNKSYKIMNVAWDLQPSSKFMNKGQEICYKDIYSGRKDVVITEDDQPLLITKLDSCGNKACEQCRGTKIIGLIPESCYLVGLTEDQESDLSVTTEMMEATNEFFEKRETNPVVFVKRVLGDKQAEEFFRHCGLYFTPPPTEDTIGSKPG